MSDLDDARRVINGVADDMISCGKTAHVRRQGGRIKDARRYIDAYVNAVQTQADLTKEND